MLACACNSCDMYRVICGAMQPPSKAFLPRLYDVHTCDICNMKSFCQFLITHMFDCLQVFTSGCLKLHWYLHLMPKHDTAAAPTASGATKHNLVSTPKPKARAADIVLANAIHAAYTSAMVTSTSTPGSILQTRTITSGQQGTQHARQLSKAMQSSGQLKTTQCRHQQTILVTAVSTADTTSWPTGLGTLTQWK